MHTSIHIWLDNFNPHLTMIPLQFNSVCVYISICSSALIRVHPLDWFCQTGLPPSPSIVILAPIHSCQRFIVQSIFELSNFNPYLAIVLLQVSIVHEHTSVYAGASVYFCISTNLLLSTDLFQSSFNTLLPSMIVYFNSYLTWQTSVHSCR